MKYCLTLWFAMMLSLNASAKTVIHYVPTEDPGDSRLTYLLELIKLSLHKTAPKEQIEFKPLPAVISYARAIHEMKRDVYPNYFTPGGANIELFGTDNLQAVDFPLDHGLLSYRICFVSPKAKDRVKKVKTIDDLRQLTIAQGTSWSDIAILKANGFQVVEVSLYTSLFKMVVSNRVDLVCRGVTELRRELIQFQHYGNLIHDESFVLIYAMPYKLYFNKSSAPLIAKIEAGLAIAHQDGSLDKLFKQYFAEDLSFAKLKQRKQFVLTSGYEKSFSDTYKRYLYDPFNAPVPKRVKK